MTGWLLTENGILWKIFQTFYMPMTETCIQVMHRHHLYIYKQTLQLENEWNAYISSFLHSLYARINVLICFETLSLVHPLSILIVSK